MTQVFTEEGTMIPVTVIEARPNRVVQIKTKETDGYRAVQIGYMDLKENRANKPTKGHFAKWGTPLKKYLAEIRLEEGEEYAAGQEIKVSDFEEGRKIDITGTSKGKGTQGNIKRHGHHRGPVSHGSKHKRLPGALAAGTYPSRVFKGNAGPGRMGRETVTVQNLDIVKIIPERNILLIKGAVPGGRGGVVCVRYACKAGYPDEVRLAVMKEYLEEEPAVEEPVTEEPATEEPETVEEVIKETAEEVVEKVEEAAVKAADAIEEAAPDVAEAIEAVEEVATEAAAAVEVAAPEAVGTIEEEAAVEPETVETAVAAVAAVVTEAVAEKIEETIAEEAPAEAESQAEDEAKAEDEVKDEAKAAEEAPAEAEGQAEDEAKAEDEVKDEAKAEEEAPIEAEGQAEDEAKAEDEVKAEAETEDDKEGEE